MQKRTLEQQRTKVRGLERKLSKMGPMVPPPIRLEVSRHLHQAQEELDAMEAQESQAQES
jgi:hypothetical protein